MKPLFGDVWCILLYYCLPRIVKSMLSVYMVVFTCSKWEVHHINQDRMNAALLPASASGSTGVWSLPPPDMCEWSDLTIYLLCKYSGATDTSQQPVKAKRAKVGTMSTVLGLAEHIT